VLNYYNFIPKIAREKGTIIVWISMFFRTNLNANKQLIPESNKPSINIERFLGNLGTIKPIMNNLNT
jgi:hypothetical protein